MTYQSEDTQPERTALAWSRSSLALFAGTIWVCRDAFVGRSPVALSVLISSLILMITNYFLVRSRKRQLSKGIDAATATGVANAVLVLQIVILALSALLQ